MGCLFRLQRVGITVYRKMMITHESERSVLRQPRPLASAGCTQMLTGSAPVRLAGERLLVGLELLIQELLNRLEKLHAVLLHDDCMRAFADFDVALVGCVG